MRPDIDLRRLDEGQDRDRYLVGLAAFGALPLGIRFLTLPPESENPHWAIDVLEAELVHVLEPQLVKLVDHVLVNGAADADPAGIGDLLDARRDVDAVAENIVLVDDDVAEVDADPELHPV